MIQRLIIIWFALWSIGAPALYFSNPSRMAALSNSVPTIAVDIYIDYHTVGNNVALTTQNLDSSTYNVTAWATNFLGQKSTTPGNNPDGSQITNLLWGTTTRGPSMGCNVLVGGQLIDARTTTYGCYYNLSVTNSNHGVWFTNLNVYGVAYLQYLKIGNDTSSGDQFVQGFCIPFVGTDGVWAYSEGTSGQIRVGVETSGGAQATIYTATGAGNGILLKTNVYYLYSFSYIAADTNTVPGFTNLGSVNIDVYSNNPPVFTLLGTTNLVVTNTSRLKFISLTGRNSGESTHPNYTNDFGPVLMRVSTTRGENITRVPPPR